MLKTRREEWTLEPNSQFLSQMKDQSRNLFPPNISTAFLFLQNSRIRGKSPPGLATKSQRGDFELLWCYLGMGGGWRGRPSEARAEALSLPGPLVQRQELSIIPQGDTEQPECPQPPFQESSQLALPQQSRCCGCPPLLACAFPHHFHT